LELTDVPTELTTAATDAVLALVGFGCVLTLLRAGRGDRWRASVWSLAIGLLSIAAGLGAFAHGFKLSLQTMTLVWQPINLALGFTMALFVVGVVRDLWGRKAAWRVLPVMVLVAVGFYLFTVAVCDLFVVFALFELVALVFAAGGYGWLTLRRRRKDFAWMAAGMSLSLLATSIQTQHHLAITIIWPLDHNGLFHLVQIAGLLVLTAGLRAGFRRPATER
jgi:hypothetical protein